MNDKELESLIDEKADSFISELQWHDTLDVQNAAKKAYKQGYQDGMENKPVKKKVAKPEKTRKKPTKSKKK